jgi:hypothetical protein
VWDAQVPDGIQDAPVLDVTRAQDVPAPYAQAGLLGEPVSPVALLDGYSA